MSIVPIRLTSSILKYGKEFSYHSIAILLSLIIVCDDAADSN